MNLKQRIRRLENKALAHITQYSLLTDEELHARIIRDATELKESGPLDPDTESWLKANGLWLCELVR